jgi:hypothetical protein
VSEVDRHRWVNTRVAAWCAGLLSEEDASAVAEHLAACESCRGLAEASAVASDATTGSHAGEHLPAALLAAWPRVRGELRGLERAMARIHLERCADCRQDLELLGHAPVLEHDPALDLAPTASASILGSLARADDASATAGEGARTAGAPTRSANASEPVETMRIIRVVGPRPRWWERALIAWSTVATAAAAIAIVVHVSRPVVEPPTLSLSSRPLTNASRRGDRTRGISLAFAPRPRSLKAPTKGPEGGHVNVIPVVGAVRSLALAVHPLSIPDTSLVMISLVNAEGDTLFAVRHRQWEFFPKRVLMIDGADEPLPPGEYALVMASLISQRGIPTPLMSRYRFELRPR